MTHMCVSMAFPFSLMHTTHFSHEVSQRGCTCVFAVMYSKLLKREAAVFLLVKRCVSAWVWRWREHLFLPAPLSWSSIGRDYAVCVVELLCLFIEDVNVELRRRNERRIVWFRRLYGNQKRPKEKKNLKSNWILNELVIWWRWKDEKDEKFQHLSCQGERNEP